MKPMMTCVKRTAALVLALVLLASGNLGLSAFAAETKSTDLYTLIATEYFSGDATAAGILVSGALKGNSTVSIRCPGVEDGLVSVENGVITAQSFDSKYSGLKWVPVSYTCGGAAGAFSGNTAEISGAGAVELSVDYKLVLSNLDRNLLRLPATIMEEAEDQMYVLDKLVDSDEPYMGYMEQLNYSKMGLIIMALTPQDPAGLGPLNSDPAKDKELRASFTETVTAMRGSCYQDKKELKIYKLLLGYVDGGLLYYYRNNKSFQTELDLFTGYMEELLGEETRNGITLTEEDKINAAEIIKAKAVSLLGTGAEIEFLELRDKMSGVRARLSEPNSAIDLGSSKLGSLMMILEKGGSVTSFDEQPTLRTSFTVNLCIHVYDNDADDTCNHCGEKRGSGSGGSGSGDSGSGSGSDDSGNKPGSGSDEDKPAQPDVDFGDIDFGSGDNASIGTADELEAYLAAARDGDVITLKRSVSLDEDVQVNCVITIENAHRLTANGHSFVLASATAGIRADAEVDVVSAVDGYVAAKESSSCTYALTEIRAPKVEKGKHVAGNKTEKLGGTRYLFLDVDPDGMCLNELSGAISFADFGGYTVDLAIEGNEGTHLVKTGDVLVATARKANGGVVASVTYVAVVMGDTNCNGKVNTSDATATKNISMGGESTLAARLAADVNFSGTPDNPKINSSDVSYVMAKWFAWDLNKYVSNLG